MSFGLHTVRPSIPACFIRPTSDETVALFNAALLQAPKTDRPEVELAEFYRAFLGQSTIYRQATLNKAFANHHWTDVVNDSLDALGQSPVSWRAVYLALVAANDVLLSDWPRLGNQGVLFEAGLNEHLGRQPKDEWRRTLNEQFAPRVIPDGLKKIASHAIPVPKVYIGGVEQQQGGQKIQGPEYYKFGAG